MRTELVALALLAACGDGAAEGAYQGRELYSVWVINHPRGGVSILDPSALDEMRFAIRWSAGEHSVTFDAPVIERVPGKWRLGVYERPPAEVWRVAERGDYAIGEVLMYLDADGDRRPGEDEVFIGAGDGLIGYAPTGADGAPIDGVMPEGFQRLVTASPCDEAPTLVLAQPAQDGAIEVTYHRDGVPGWADERCAEARSVRDVACPSLAVTRWLCRFGPREPESICDQCLLHVFPEGASAEQCDTWLERCGSRPECEDETRVCLAGEPASNRSCDLRCACSRYWNQCLQSGRPGDLCLADIAFCPK